MAEELFKQPNRKGSVQIKDAVLKIVKVSCGHSRNIISLNYIGISLSQYPKLRRL